METRFVRNEMVLLRWLSAFLSELFYFKDDMKKRLGMIDDGQQRVENLIDETASLLKDILSTGTENQVKQLKNAIIDYRVELVPKCTPGSNTVVMTKEQAERLVDFAQERCRECIESNEDALKCPLYKFLEITAVPDSYDTMLCPYSHAQWAD